MINSSVAPLRLTQVIKEDSTVVVTSLNCNESVCFTMINGMIAYNFVGATDKNEIMELCKKKWISS